MPSDRPMTDNSFPSNGKGATLAAPAKRFMGQGRSDRPAERPSKTASDPGHKPGAAWQELGQNGRLGGNSDQDVTDWTVGGDCQRQSFAYLAPYGDVYGLAVAVDEAVRARDAYNIAGFES